MDRVVYCVWFGDEMSANRKKSLKILQENSNVQVILITEENLHCFILKKYPLHEGFRYLSAVHKSDYMRTYLMNFHGGGYCDIKPMPMDWNPYFDELEQSGCIGIGTPDPMATKYFEEFNLCFDPAFFIFKPHTALTEKWYRLLLQKMDEKLHLLRKFPAKHPYESDFNLPLNERQENYPIHWVEIMADNIHPLCVEFKDELLMTFYPLRTHTSEYR